MPGVRAFSFQSPLLSPCKAGYETSRVFISFRSVGNSAIASARKARGLLAKRVYHTHVFLRDVEDGASEDQP